MIHALIAVFAAFPFYAEFEDGGRLCVVDTHPLTVRADNGTLFVRPWRTSEWRELDDPGADYGECMKLL